jgi:hypothetical protein
MKKGSKKPRQKLTTLEWNALQKLLTRTQLDMVFYLVDAGKKDFIFAEDPDKIDKYIKESIYEGSMEIYDALGYPLKHEGLDDEETQAIVALWEELGVIDERGKEWLLEEEVLI